MSTQPSNRPEALELIGQLERHISVQRTIHESSRRGWTTNIQAMRELLKRVEKQRDDAWLRIEALEQQLLTTARGEIESEGAFEAHLEGMDCGNRSCRTCNSQPPQGDSQ
jgi:hypothetical protein